MARQDTESIGTDFDFDNIDPMDRRHLILWGAVLKQGVIDYKHSISRDAIYKSALDYHITRWMHSDDIYPGSLKWILDLVGTDIDLFRRRLRAQIDGRKHACAR